MDNYIQNIYINLIKIAIILFAIGIVSPFFNFSYTDSLNNLLKVDNIGSVGDFLSGSTTHFSLWQLFWYS